MNVHASIELLSHTSPLIVRAVHSKTALPAKSRYTFHMESFNTKAALTAGWVLALAAIAMATDVSRSVSWFAFAIIGLLPPFVLFRLSIPFAPKASESREALR